MHIARSLEDSGPTKTTKAAAEQDLGLPPMGKEMGLQLDVGWQDYVGRGGWGTE